MLPMSVSSFYATWTSQNAHVATGANISAASINFTLPLGKTQGPLRTVISRRHTPAASTVNHAVNPAGRSKTRLESQLGTISPASTSCPPTLVLQAVDNRLF